MIAFLASADTGNFVQDTQLYERSVASTNTLLDLWWLAALLLVVLVLTVWLSFKSRMVSKLDANCKSAFADIDALLSERHALIPNLVEVTKAHVHHELAVLDRVIEAQQKALETTGANRMHAETEVGNAINQLVNAAAVMPDLESSNEYRNLKKELIRIEEKVTASRRYYNTTVAEYEAVKGGFVAGFVSRIGGHGDHRRYDLGEKREQLAEPQRIAFS